MSKMTFSIRPSAAFFVWLITLEADVPKEKVHLSKLGY